MLVRQTVGTGSAREVEDSASVAGTTIPSTIGTSVESHGASPMNVANDTATRMVDAGVRPPPVIVLPVERRPDRFELLQQFEGTVLDVGEGEFSARLVDRTHPQRPTEIATFESSEVSEGDLPLLHPGAVFYLSIGYRIRSWGQRVREFTISFRRIPVWTRTDLAAIRANASEWRYMLDDDGSD